MPNWCWNSVRITGETSEIERLLGRVRRSEDGGVTLLGTYYPCPDELMDSPSPAHLPRAEEMTEKYGSPDWYSWCSENWGTKWSECQMHIQYEKGSNTALLDFDTAYAPPLTGYAEISKQFPSLIFEFYYEEPGCAFCGDARIVNGEVEDDCRDYIDEDAEDEEDEYDSDVA